VVQPAVSEVKEVALMKRILLVASVAALMAAMLAVMAVPAFATIHPLANSECANASALDVATGQTPPGLSGQSQGNPPNNGAGGTIAQPVFAVTGGDFSSDSPALKTPIVFPEPNYCPANK
jgi:hypothetical protein